MKIAIIFHRLIPYHITRLQALTRYFEVLALEGAQKDEFYPWDSWDAVKCDLPLHICTLFQDDKSLEQAGREGAYHKIATQLDLFQPDAVAVNGWASILALSTLKWCTQTRTPAIMMSDSTEFDSTRKWYKERIKSRIVNLCASCFVGGEPHVRYIKKLGIPERQIFQGYDVVDNEYFMKNALLIRNAAGRRTLPEKFIFSCSRFVEKKNLERLIKGYAEYKYLVGSTGSKLIVAGDGPLRNQLESLVKILHIEDDVFFPGFLQYKDLPMYFSLAQFFIHASITEQWGLVVNEAMASSLPVLVSRNCGCAQDLVQEGVNGFTFNPYDEKEIGRLILKLSTDSKNLDKMGQKSLEIIRHWSPETFSRNLLKSAERAVSFPRKKAGILDKVVLNMLIFLTSFLSNTSNK